MKNPFTALFRARDKPRDSVSAAPVFYFGTSGAGKSVTAQTAIQLSTVYACVRVISETVASLPLDVYEAKEDGNRKATEHPLYRLIHDEPNSEMTSFVLREVMLAHLLLWGNSYCQIIPFEKVLRGNPHCTFAVNFRCYPFFYADATAEIMVTTSGTIITNPGSVYSEPILTVTGSGNITLMVDMTIVELENISGSIVIDSVLQEAYQGSTLMNDHMNGEFPVLKPGANAISWTGAVTKVVVRPNWRYL